MCDSTSDKEMVTVRVFGNLGPAQLASSLLESEGIPNVLNGLQIRGLWNLVGQASELRLTVPAEYAEKAREILEDSDLAREDPGQVHYICDPDDHHPELRDMDNLQLDLVSLTLCSLGHGAPRPTIEAQLGDVVVHTGDPVEIRKPDLGAIFYLDEDQRLEAFFVAIQELDDYPDLQSFPGFWEPGSHLEPPTEEDLSEIFGSHTEKLRDAEDLVVRWVLETASVEARFDPRERLLCLLVEYTE